MQIYIIIYVLHGNHWMVNLYYPSILFGYVMVNNVCTLYFASFMVNLFMVNLHYTVFRYKSRHLKASYLIRLWFLSTVGNYLSITTCMYPDIRIKWIHLVRSKYNCVTVLLICLQYYCACVGTPLHGFKKEESLIIVRCNCSSYCTLL